MHSFLVTFLMRVHSCSFERHSGLPQPLHDHNFNLLGDENSHSGGSTVGERRPRLFSSIDSSGG